MYARCLRPRPDAPPFFRTLGEQRSRSRRELGWWQYLVLHVMPLAPGMHPAFWLEGCDAYYEVPARTAQERYWAILSRVMRFFGGLFVFQGVGPLVLSPWLRSHGDEPDFTESPALLFAGAVHTALGLVFDAKNIRFARAKIIDWIDTTHEEQAAAAVAALVSRMPLTTALHLAKQNFVVLDFDQLSAEHLMSNQDTGLAGKARPCELGKCNAFISHSWAGAPHSSATAAAAAALHPPCPRIRSRRAQTTGWRSTRR